MQNEVIPFLEAAYTQKLTVHFVGAVSGKLFCGPLTSPQSGWSALSADPLPTGDGSNIQTAGLPAAAGQVGGVVGWDVAAGAKGPVIRGAGTFLPVTSGAAIAVGDELQVDAAGKVVPFSAGRKVGKAHSAVAGANLDVVVELYATGAA